MKAPVYDTELKKVKEIDLPPHFEEEVRPDLISRAVLAIYSHKRHPYGAYEYAGLDTSAWTSKRRRNYRTSYGYGISRVPRAVLWGKPHYGGVFSWVARRVAQAVKGMKAHAPTPEKNWYEKINKKERRKAIRSAIAATANEYFVLNRYTKAKKWIEPVIKNYGLPLVIEGLEDLNKAKEVKQIFYKLFPEELLEHFSETKQRAGKGKRRGRRIVKSRGILLVVSDSSKPIWKAARNLEFLEVWPVRQLNAEVLAPGCKPGRLTVWTEEAIEILKNENLFY